MGPCACRNVSTKWTPYGERGPMEVQVQVQVQVQVRSGAVQVERREEA